MRLPFISRKKYDQALRDHERVIAYIPLTEQEYEDHIRDKSVVADEYCFHDRRIGWVRRAEFGTYEEYCAYLKDVYHENGWDKRGA